MSIPHGWADPNVCTLTTAEVDVDPLTGMVWQSGLPVQLSPPKNQGLVDKLLACPAQGWFVPIESETTVSLDLE